MGCIARLYADVKNDLIWQVQRVGVATHGVKVRTPITSVVFFSLSIIVDVFLTNCAFSCVLYLVL
jgi:hypothetical protein